jgi:hypothetical protein
MASWPEPASQAPPITVTGFTPTSGPQGTSVTITGSGFMAAGLNGVNNVTFAGNQAHFTIVSDSEIVATVPNASTGPIMVGSTDYTPAVNTWSAASFTFVSPPAIDQLDYSTGPPGTVITAQGTNLDTVSQVTFNGAAIAFTSNGTSLATQIPANAAAGAGTLVVTSTGGSANATFTVAPLPRIDSISPASGGPGTTVVVNGANLENVTAVTLNNTVVADNVSSTADGSTLTITLPSWATTGSIGVNSPAGNASGPIFTVTAAGANTPTTGTGSSTSPHSSGPTTSNSSQGSNGSTSAASTGTSSTSPSASTAPAPTVVPTGVTVSTPVVRSTGPNKQAVSFSIVLGSATVIHVTLVERTSGKHVLEFATRATKGRNTFTKAVPKFALKKGAHLTLKVAYVSHGETHTTSVPLKV